MKKEIANQEEVEFQKAMCRLEFAERNNLSLEERVKLTFLIRCNHV